MQETFSLIIRNDFITPDSTDPNIKISSFRDYVLANMVVLSNDMYYLLKKEETTVAYKI